MNTVTTISSKSEDITTVDQPASTQGTSQSLSGSFDQSSALTDQNEASAVEPAQSNNPLNRGGSDGQRQNQPARPYQGNDRPGSHRQPQPYSPPQGRDRSNSSGAANYSNRNNGNNTGRGYNPFRYRLEEIKRLAAEDNQDAKFTLDLAQELKEPNLLALDRLVYLFGQKVIRAKANEAHTLYKKGRDEGPNAYQPSPNGTALAVHSGRARSLGGVFFYVIKQHIASIGLNYEALFIPEIPRFKPPTSSPKPAQAKNQSQPHLADQTQYQGAQPSKPTSVLTEAEATSASGAGETLSGPPLPSSSLDDSAPVLAVAQPPRIRTAPGSTPGRGATPGRFSSNPNPATARSVRPVVAPNSTDPTPATASATGPLPVDPEQRQPPVAANGSSSTPIKPSRIKATVIGVLSGPPKLNPQNRAGLVELVINTEMSPNLPKGLPNLGDTRVVVWCTERQFSRVKESLHTESRLIVEGEIAGAVSADFTPFVRLVCLKITTVELEQASRANSNPGEQQSS